MSKIAQALAKATERTGHTTAPFLTGMPPRELPGRETKEAELRKARIRWRFWRFLAFTSFPITALILWLQFGGTRNHKPDMPTTAAAEEFKSTSAMGAQNTNRVAIQTDLKPDATREELQARVRAFVFTALMPGARPRVVYKGRVIEMGDHIDDDLIFGGLQNDQLIFKDAAGEIYLRRY